ncbi:lysylphosphatidylglycerol synthase domain-containing protein [Sulfuriflexus sp.]|uniref:lysylphosphatidylglycerol synthase domain-containing protein n=1 Tax=Sulfuriflexus sp. TaxID=2015443 RepID=UPI0028CC86F0|nr:lysylphosphatidylglycerol synthase domain-containing protein [Sulfuriflexus sp.]MDT8404341.1 lysylphosphatidylglycerol synthase domain-containing protein [Sulfuriflexus sp.]
MPDRHNRWLSRIEYLFSFLRTGSAGQHKKLLTFAIILFFFGLFYSLYESQHSITSLDWLYILIILALCLPPTIIINGVRYKYTSSLAHNHISTQRALNISILSSAANILPLPGGVMVKLANLKKPENTYSDSFQAILTASFLWLSLTSMYSGGWLIYFKQFSLGYTMLLTGACLSVYASLTIRKITQDYKILLALLLIEILAIQVDVIRMYFAFKAIGIDTSYAQCSVFAITSIMGSIVSIVPAGLGVREIFAALISTTIDIQASHAYIAVSINRILGLTVIIPVTYFLLKTSPDPPAEH